MIKEVRRHGNSHAIVLDKALLELLGIRAGSQLQVTISEGSLVLTPVDGRPPDRRMVEEELTSLGERFRSAFEDLG